MRKEEHVEGSVDFNDEDYFGELAIEEEEDFAFEISDEEEHQKFMFKTSTEDVEETDINEDKTTKEDVNVYKKQEPTNNRKQSGMMWALTEQLAQRDKRTESGTTTPAITTHNNRLQNGLKSSGTSSGAQERIATIPEMPSLAIFSNDPQLYIKSSVQTKPPSKSVQSASRKSFEVQGPLEASMKNNLMQRSKESDKMSTVVSDGESVPENSNSEEENDEVDNEDNVDEEDDFGPVPKSRRNETMIDHRAKNRILEMKLSMGDFANEFFAPELDREYARSRPRHRASFSIDIQPTIKEETKSAQEEVDSENDSAEDEKNQ